MASKVALLLIFVFPLFLMVGDCRAYIDCGTSSKCTSDGPEIRYPFRLKEQPRHCGYPGFELSCNPNGTVIDLDRYDTLAREQYYVSSISYEDQLLTLLNPYGCFGAVIFNLNLSSSPFSYFRPYSKLFNDRYAYDTLEAESYFSYFSYYRMKYKALVSSDFIGCPKNSGEFSTDSLNTSCMIEAGHPNVYFLSMGVLLDSLPEGCQKLKTVSFNLTYARCDYCVLSVKEGLTEDRLINLFWDSPPMDSPPIESPSAAPWTSPVDDLFEFQNDSHEGTLAKDLAIGLSTAAFFFALVLTTVIVTVYRSRKTNREETENQKVEKFLQNYRALKPKRYSYGEIKKITDQFKVKLGEGGYGSVFKGALSNGTPVAVKILKMFKLGDIGEDFINEVGTIGRIHHINVVRLLGFCAEGFKKALVYEFMPNSSLDKFIFKVGEEAEGLLGGWKKLQSIALGIAKGMEYLHQGCEQRILHFDIKPNNILLDHNFNPKIADFGLAKLCSKEKSIVSMTAVRGTVGYIAPEVLSRNSRNVSYKSDVYSFGMLLLEMVGGRKNIDATVENASRVYFPEWAYGRLQLGVDDLGVKMEEVGDGEIAKKLTMVAFWCIQWYPVERPSMKTVVQMLEGNLDGLTMPPNPFAASAGRTNTRLAARLPPPGSTHGSAFSVIVE